MKLFKNTINTGSKLSSSKDTEE